MYVTSCILYYIIIIVIVIVVVVVVTIILFSRIYSNTEARSKKYFERKLPRKLHLFKGL